MFSNMEQVQAFFKERSNFGIKPGLSRMYDLLDYVNSPHEKLKAVHITGTNGKGSTLNFITQALVANAYKVGLFTSPSLTGLRGHIYINNECITEAEWIERLNYLYPAIYQLDAQDNHPTEFEILTVLAFDYFVDRVDIALIETGMGGRADTTNCLHPILSIITNIDKDHTHFLGPTIKDIAYHKAGIIKHKVPAIIGNVDKSAFEVIKEELKQRKTTGLFLGNDFIYHTLTSSEIGEQFIWSDDQKSRHVTIHMYGHHQVENCSIALMALTIIEKSYLKIDWQKVSHAIEQTNMPGRFEEIKQNPPIILDGAHNLAGIQAFLKTVKTHYTHEPKHLIFAAFKDKDITSILSELENVFTSITLTTFKHKRAANMEDLTRHSKKNQHFYIEDWKVALKQIESNDNYYFITGSLHFISAVRQYLNEPTSIDENS